MFTFNGISSIGKLRVLSVKRSLIAPSKVRVFEIDGKSGGHFLGKTSGMKKIEVEVAVIGASPSNLKTKTRDIARWLDKDEPKSLVFSDEPTLTDYAIVDGDTDFDEEFKHGTGTIVFLCPDPHSVAQTRNETLTNGGSKSITLQGSAETFPTITATATTTSPKYTVTLGQEKVEVVDAFKSGDVIVINMETGRVTINGNLALQTVTFASDFWSLKPDVTNSVVSSSGFTASMSFKERYK